jgi:hypothetical protein
MTPRTLLTAFGATALAFAIAIGVAADSTFDVATDSAPTAVSMLETSSEAYLDISGSAGARLNAGNDSCVIAV